MPYLAAILLVTLIGQDRTFPVDAPWNDGFQWWRPKHSNSIFVAVPPEDFQACAYNADETVAVCASAEANVAVIQFPDDSLTHVRVLPSGRRLDIVPGEIG